MSGYDDRTFVNISVRGMEPVPWSVPDRGRWGGSLPNPRLVEWQDAIRKAAKEAFGPLQPWTGVIILQAQFSIARGCPNKRSLFLPACPTFKYDELYEKWRQKGKAADLTNLIKAAEDALQGVVYVDDSQVCFHDRCTRHWSKYPGVELNITRA